MHCSYSLLRRPEQAAQFKLERIEVAPRVAKVVGGRARYHLPLGRSRYSLALIVPATFQSGVTDSTARCLRAMASG